MTYPTIMPALTLDFQNSKQLDPRVTFSRSSSATYTNSAGLVTSAADHEARFDHDGNGESLGLLMEESGTNLVLSSADYNASGWTRVGVSATANSGTAPDGTNNASLLESTVNGVASLKYYVTTTGYATLSVYAKAGTSSGITLYFHDDQIRFDLAAATITTNNIPSTVLATSIEAMGNGWYRCSVTSNRTGQTEKRVMVNNSDGSYQASIGDNVLIWGVQIEEGQFPTSLIPTSGSTVTRAVDVLQITGDNFSSWYNPSQGSLFGEYVANGGFCRFRIWNGVGNNLNYWQIGATSVAGGVMGAGTRSNQGASTTSDHPGRIDANTNYGFKVRHAFGISVGGSSCYTFSSSGDSNLNTGGAANTTDYAAPLVDRFQVHDLESSINIARLSYYSERLTDTQLEAIAK